MPKIEELLKAYEKAQYKYLSYGITTAQDGMTYSSLIPIYENLISNDILNIDLVSYIEVKNKEIFFNTFKNSIKQYYKHFKNTQEIYEHFNNLGYKLYCVNEIMSNKTNCYIDEYLVER